MYDLTGVINDTQPKLPENPLIYFEEYNNKLLTMDVTFTITYCMGKYIYTF